MPNVTARPYPGNAVLADGSVTMTGDLTMGAGKRIALQGSASGKILLRVNATGDSFWVRDSADGAYANMQALDVSLGVISTPNTVDGVDISVASPSSGEGHVFVDPYSYSAVVAGTWAHADVASQPRSGYLYNSTRAQNDKIRFTKIYLAKGTYTIMFVTATGAAAGILKVDFDGVNKGSVDCYSAGTVYGVQKTIAAVAVAASGLVEVDVYSDTKHASSTNYDMYLTSIVFYRTA